MRILLFCAAILFPLVIQAQECFWVDEYKKAYDLSRERKQPVLIVFLGSHECPWSQKLEMDVLENNEFIETLKDDFILCRTREPQIAKKYQIKEIPAIALDFQGETIAKIQYLPLSAQEYATTLKELFFDFQLLKMTINHHYLKPLGFDQLKTIYQKAVRLENQHFKDAILAEGLKKDRGAYFMLLSYASLIEKEKLKDRNVQKLRMRILDRDPKNEHGTHLKVALTEFQAIAKKLKPHKAIKPLLEYAQKFGKQDHENLWKVEMMLAQYLFTHKLLKEALFHASLSYEAAPEAAKDEVSQSIEYFKIHSP